MVNQSVATSSKKTVATDSTVKKSRNITRKLYEQVSKTCSWWYPKYTPSGYKWKPKSQKEMLTQTLVTVKFGNDQIATNFLHGEVWKSQAYYVEGLSYFIAPLVNSEMGLWEVAFRKSTFYIRSFKEMIFFTEGIRHETSTARTPEQNGIVERRNRTLVEAARTMLSAAKVPLFFWAEAIATAFFYLKNRSLVIPDMRKHLIYIINARKPSVKFFHIFGSLCYIVRDGENLDKRRKRKQRRQLETDGEMCMFALTVSRTEPKNIKEAMADSAGCESIRGRTFISLID
ncbi:retrovirus-related pol polyprotein from transposon TNT 1-94 [Tanacetum coccineum]|uniref:Retrovirus-related pol polyprotein from transposon TNT 1-94 n=1 Tax=Tanacetum coccineum TaxID=301880 RepID=A0ABQ5ER95_9ASTR